MKKKIISDANPRLSFFQRRKFDKMDKGRQREYKEKLVSTYGPQGMYKGTEESMDIRNTRRSRKINSFFIFIFIFISILILIVIHILRYFFY